jgi:hypothetical protein
LRPPTPWPKSTNLPELCNRKFSACRQMVRFAVSSTPAYKRTGNTYHLTLYGNMEITINILYYIVKTLVFLSQ